MYLDKTPEVGDLIQVTDPECLAARKKAGMLCSGLVTSVTDFGGIPYLNFKSGSTRTGVAMGAVKVLDRSNFGWRKPVQPDFSDSEQAGL